MASVKKTTTTTGETRYRVRYRDPDGKCREKWFRRKVDADRHARNVEVDKDRGLYVDPYAQRVTFGEMAERWQEVRQNNAQATLDRDASYLRSLILPTFEKRRISTIRPSEVEAWINALPRASTTRAKALQMVKSVLDLASRDGLIPANPAATVKSPSSRPQREPRALADDEIAALIAAAEAVDERTAVVVHLMVRCGLRIGEALALRRVDVDLDSGKIAVRTSMRRDGSIGPVKGRKAEHEGRAIPIPMDMSSRLRRHFTERPVSGIDQFVATAPRGGPLQYSNWRSRVWTRIIERVDFDAIPHDLRRTAATRLFIEDRWTPAEVQAFLGHGTPHVTLAIYTIVEAETLPRPSAFTATVG